MRWIYASLPILLIVASQAILRVRSETGGIVTFGLAGLACGRLWSGALAGLTGGPLGIVYVFGSLVAAAMLVVALAVVVPVAKARAKFF